MGLRENLSKIGSHFIILKKYGSSLPIILFLIWIILIIISQVILLISGFDILYLSLKDKIELSLTFAIACFAGVQTIREIERRKIERLQNELEKAYGPLYGLLNSPEVKKRQVFVGEIQKKIAGVSVSKEEKNELDSIFITYSYMFPKDLFELWVEKVRYLQSHKYDLNERTYYFAIPTNFKERINEERDHKVQEYCEIT